MPIPESWRNALVNAQAGATKSNLFPDTMYVRLLDGNPQDPDDPGAELTSAGGYARIGPIDMTSASIWPAAVGGTKANETQINGTASSGAYSDVATWAQMVNTASGTPTVYGPSWQLGEEIDVNAAGVTVSLPPGSIVISELDLFTDILDEE
jgi:hypothetical protein